MPTRHLRALAALAAALAAALGAVLAVVLPAGSAAASGTGGGEVVRAVVQGADGPAADVTIRVEGDGFSEEFTTDEEGRGSLELPGPGTYTVELDVESLPEGAQLRNPDQNPRTLDVGGGEQATALFPLGESQRETVSRADRLWQSTVYGLRFGLLLALAAVGLSLIFGTTGLTNFAHGELVTFGGILSYYVTVEWFGLPFLVAVVAVFLTTGVFGLLQDFLLWGYLRRRGTGLIAMMIVSIGLAIFLRYSYLLIFEGRTRSIRVDSWLNEVVSFGSANLRVLDLVSMAICVVAILAVAFLLLRTRIGKATRAVADNPALASASGIDVERVVRSVWFLGAALAGLAGLLLGGIQQVSFAMGFQMLLLIFAAVTLGGLGTAFGALAGALVVGWVVEVSVVFGVPAEVRNVAALAILILVLLVRPQGILGRRERIG